MKNVKSSIIELIGGTPIVELKENINNNSILVKIESFNPSSSVKDRAALAMIENAERNGLIDKNTSIIEPSSGNTGVSLAMICAVKSYRLIITMPESMSIERRNLIKGFGADIVLTPAEKGMKGALEKAKELANSIENSYIPMQFDNSANPETHYYNTAQEIWNDTNAEVDIIVAGVGTGGTFSGVSKALKEKNKNIVSVAVEPEDSPVLSGGEPSPHKIQGIGAGFIPQNMNVDLIDEIIKVSNSDAINTAKDLMKNEGILCGISSGANVFAAKKIAKSGKFKDKKILCFICDTGERYLSTDLFK